MIFPYSAHTVAMETNTENYAYIKQYVLIILYIISYIFHHLVYHHVYDLCIINYCIILLCQVNRVTRKQN